MTTQLGDAHGKIVIDTSGVRSAVASANRALGSMRTSLGGAARVMTGALAVGTTALVGGLTAVGVSGVKMAMDLEQQMANIQAVMGASTEEIKALEDEIVDLGLDPNLKVSTEEAAAAIEMLGRNGLTTTEILNGAAKSTVLLANATGAEFSTAADVATDVMAIFNVKAEDMMDAVNGITGVTTNSKFTVEDYAGAIAQGGSVIESAGGTLTDFNAIVAMSSSAFASGSDLGTAYKTMIQRIVAPTDKAAGVMRELGLEFFDAEGKMKGMNEISVMMNKALSGTSEVMVEVGGRTAEQNAELDRLQTAYGRTEQKIRDYELGILGASMTEEARSKKIADLNASLVTMEGNMSPLLAITGEMTTVTRQLTNEEKNLALTTIFGADAIRMANEMVDGGAVVYGTAAEAAEALGLSIDQVSMFAEGGITKMEEFLLTTGDTDATAMAATRMDTLAGSIEIMGGVVDAIKLKFGQLFGGFIRDKVEAFTGFLDTASTAVFRFIEMVSDGMEPVQALGYLLSSLGIPPAQQVQIREFATRFMELKDTLLSFINEVVIPFVTKHKDEFIGALIAIGAVIMGAGVIGAVLALMNPLTAVIAIVGLLGAAWAGNWGGIQEKTTAVIEWLKPYVLGAIQSIKDFWAENGDAIVAEAIEIWGFVSSTISSYLNFIWNDVLVPIVTAIALFWSQHGEAIVARAIATWTLIYQTISSYLQFIWDGLVIIATALQEFWAAHGDSMLEIASAAWELIVQYISDMWDVLDAALQVFIDLFTGDWDALGKDLQKLWEAAWTLVVNYLGGLWDMVSPYLSDLWVSIRDWFNGIDWGSLGRSLIEGIAGGISSASAMIKDAITRALNEAWEAAKAAVGYSSPAKLYIPLGAGQVQGLVKGTKAMAGKLKSAMRGVMLGGATAASAVTLRPPSAMRTVQSQIGASSDIPQSPSRQGNKSINAYFYGPVTIDNAKADGGILAQIQPLMEAG